MRRPSAQRGFTLIEMAISLIVLAIVFAAVTDGIRAAYRTQRSREFLARVQGESRDALKNLEEDVRAGSLGASNGVIVSDASAEARAVLSNPVALRPAVQIFDNVPGGSDLLPIKPGTDALLVVAALRGSERDLPEALVTRQTYHDATEPFRVSELGWFRVDQYVLIGYSKATFARVLELNPPEMRIAVTSDRVFPDGKAEPGMRVRPAAAHLYYVDTEDRLVRVNVAAPRAPVAETELSNWVVLARGIENLQVECQVEGGLGVLSACPGRLPVAPASPIIAESVPAGLADDAAGGPIFDDVSIATLRMVDLTVVAHSPLPTVDERGDDPIAIGNQTALLPSHNPEGRYVRRMYRLPVGVRNTSLGAL